MGQMTEIDTGVDRAVRPPALAPQTGLRRGRTWMLAVGDLAALAVAYAAAYAVADRIAPLPPVQAPSWFLILVAVTAPVVWLGIFTAYHLYENDNLRISVSSFDEVRDLFHAILAGSLGYLIVSQGVEVLLRLVGLRAGRGRALPRRCARHRPDRPRLDPELGLPAADEAASDAHRGKRR